MYYEKYADNYLDAATLEPRYHCKLLYRNNDNNVISKAQYAKIYTFIKLYPQ